MPEISIVILVSKLSKTSDFLNFFDDLQCKLIYLNELRKIQIN